MPRGRGRAAFYAGLGGVLPRAATEKWDVYGLGLSLGLLAGMRRGRGQRRPAAGRRGPAFYRSEATTCRHSVGRYNRRHAARRVLALWRRVRRHAGVVLHPGGHRCDATSTSASRLPQGASAGNFGRTRAGVLRFQDRFRRRRIPTIVLRGRNRSARRRARTHRILDDRHVQESASRARYQDAGGTDAGSGGVVLAVPQALGNRHRRPPAFKAIRSSSIDRGELPARTAAALVRRIRASRPPARGEEKKTPSPVAGFLRENAVGAAIILRGALGFPVPLPQERERGPSGARRAGPRFAEESPDRSDGRIGQSSWGGFLWAWIFLIRSGQVERM